MAHLAERMRALSVAVCNVTRPTSLVPRSIRAEDLGRVQTNGVLSLGYVPRLRKCGSATLDAALDVVFGKPSKHNGTLSCRPGRARCSTTGPHEGTRADLFALRKSILFTVTRHPLDKALAGFHMVEIFLRMGWLTGRIRSLQLSWWNVSCIDAPNGTLVYNREGPHTCLGRPGAGTADPRFNRLHAFLDDIMRVGYFDEHIFPITQMLYLSKSARRAAGDWMAIDIANHSALTGLLSEHAGVMTRGSSLFGTAVGVLADPGTAEVDRSGTHQTHHPMSRGATGNPAMPWAIRLDELVRHAQRDPTAAAALNKLCCVYSADLECMRATYPAPYCDARQCAE